MNWFTDPCGPRFVDESLPWQSPQAVNDVEVQGETNASAEMFVFFPAASTGWYDALAGLRTVAISVWPTGWEVQEEWHLKQSSYSVAAARVSDGSTNVYAGATPAPGRLPGCRRRFAPGAGCGSPRTPHGGCSSWSRNHRERILSDPCGAR